MTPSDPNGPYPHQPPREDLPTQPMPDQPRMPPGWSPGMPPGMLPGMPAAAPGAAAQLPAPTPAVTGRPSRSAALVMVALIGSAVSLTLGVYGRLHSPTGVAVNIAGFSGPLEVKVWLASLVFALALVQLVSALTMYGRIPRVTAPGWISPVHRWSGRLAFLAAVPVAIHCLYALGFQTYDTRVLVHSLAGCLFFGAFTVKMLSLSRSGLPGWLLPLFGGVVFAGLTVLWLTSSLWFFTTVGVRF
jgi:Family of unknown function (DUF6529)